MKRDGGSRGKAYKILEHYDGSKTDKELAEIVGCSRPYVVQVRTLHQMSPGGSKQKWMQRLSLADRRKLAKLAQAPSLKPRARWVFRLLAAGNSYAEAAAIIGCTRDVVAGVKYRAVRALEKI